MPLVHSNKPPYAHTAQAWPKSKSKKKTLKSNGTMGYSLRIMTQAQLRQWVEADPERINDRVRHEEMPLNVAVCELESLSLITWLVDEKGADEEDTTLFGSTPPS
jgi:hypothetical protein